jgi:hypothetical protein
VTIRNTVKELKNKPELSNTTSEISKKEALGLDSSV